MPRLLMSSLFALLLASPIAAQDVYRFGAEHVTAPKVLEMANPAYPASARALGIQGVIGLEVDVLPNGTVGTVALVKGLNPELDEIAAATAKKFKFTPGTKDGMPVAVRIALEFEFNLRSGPPMKVLDGPALSGQQPKAN